MNTWFSVRVQYDKVDEQGKSVKAKEVYLIDALSFTEAEARAIGELAQYISGEMRVTAMKIEDIAEIFNTEDEAADRWYRVKAVFIQLNEKTLKQQKRAQISLVKGKSTEDATNRFHEGMKGTMADYEIHTVSETQFVDVFFYALDKPTDDTR